MNRLLFLGSLERQVLEHLWSVPGEASVRDVHQALAGSHAYTTLMTTLDRLHKKGLLLRRKEGRAFLYTPQATREAMERGLAISFIKSLLPGSPRAARPVLSCLVETVGEHDHRLLEELARLVSEERIRLAKRGR